MLSPLRVAAVQRLCYAHGMTKTVQLDAVGQLVAPTHYSSAQVEAYRAGWAAGSACAEPGDDRFMVNPYDGDAEPDLYDAWDAGLDLALS